MKNVRIYELCTLVIMTTLVSLSTSSAVVTSSTKISSIGTVQQMSAKNWALVPECWIIGDLSFAPTFLDYNVLHNGRPSVRMERGDGTKSREILCRDKAQFDERIRVNPGDRIVFKVWMKTSASTIGDNTPHSGVRLGIDAYAGGTRITGLQTPSGGYWTPSGGWPPGEHLNYVNWGRDWELRTMDFIVENQYPADPFTANPGQLMTPDRIVPWIHVWSNTYRNADNGIAWFANAELYINPR